MKQLRTSKLSWSRAVAYQYRFYRILNVIFLSIRLLVILLRHFPTLNIGSKSSICGARGKVNLPFRCIEGSAKAGGYIEDQGPGLQRESRPPTCIKPGPSSNP